MRFHNLALETHISLGYRFILWKCVVARCEHVGARIVHDVLVRVHTSLVAEVADGIGGHVIACRRSHDLPVLALLVLRNSDWEGR